MSKPTKSAGAKKRATPKHDVEQAHRINEALFTEEVTRVALLLEANDLIYGPREADYGDPRKNFDDIATGWEIIFGTEITAKQVCMAMIWLKECRILNGGDKRDSWLDIAGYAGLSERLTGI